MCQSNAKVKKCDFTLDLKVVRELLLTICVINAFQTDGAEYRKEHLANSVVIVGLSSSGTSDEHRAVLSKVDDFATFKKVEVHAENSTF